MTLPDICNTLIGLQCDYNDLRRQIEAEALVLESTITSAQTQLAIRCQFLEVLAEKSKVLESLLPKLMAHAEQIQNDRADDWWRGENSDA